MRRFSFVGGLMWLWLSLLTIHASLNNARVGLLEAKLQELRVDNALYARKLQELKMARDTEISRLQCQYDVAVAGFRGGHAAAFRLRAQGAFEACELWHAQLSALRSFRERIPHILVHQSEAESQERDEARPAL